MENRKYDVLLRFTATALLILTALLVRFDTQKKLLYNTFVKTATFDVLDSLVVLVWIDLAAATYNLIRILGCFFFPIKQDFGTFYRSVAWVCYLLDQAVVYVVLGATSAAACAAFLAITGARSLQWMKLCDRFTRFCFQIGVALLCGLVASLVLAMVSSFSAYRLFRLYSPKQFLQLKKNKTVPTIGEEIK